ncbi:AhpC-TSA-domain-containing protein [Xylariaceae sp. FL0804]|nr:AhpC-TSA-domain-containing protein [Xylariaceae sp. FL0804]
MPVELRKRKPAEPQPQQPAAKKPSRVSQVAAKVKEAVTGKPAEGAAKPEPAPGSASPAKPVAGGTVALDGFGGEVETNDGVKTTLKALVDNSGAGVVLFTYPKASTPGCTQQACLFRDAYDDLTRGGLAIYGLSTDSPRANSTFKARQNLPYPLICDASASLIAAVGFKKTPRGTQRGVFAVDKAGRVLLCEAGGPAATVEAVRKLVAAAGDSSAGEIPSVNGGVAKEEGEEQEEEKKAEEAAVDKPAA